MRRTEPLGQRINVPMNQRLVDAIDEWRRLQRDIPNRAEAIRRLVEQSLGLRQDGDAEGES
jgi:metal-responsive CopG/Arc/MetJ family transcriptional regulator